jgi:CheY-like chemotaxis protein
MNTDATILVVEDEAIALLLLRKILESLGFKRIFCESTGREAIWRAEQEKPDIVLMDIGLPGDINGIEAAQAILERIQAQLMFITGYSDAQTRADAQALNPARYFEKPLNIDLLKEALQSLDA